MFAMSVYGREEMELRYLSYYCLQNDSLGKLEVTLRIQRVVWPLVIVALFGLTGTASAASLSGTWSGGGYVKPTDGKRERVHCRVTYSQQSSKVFSVSAVCASKSNKIRQSGEVLKVSSTRYVGDFYNSQFDISGRVRVKISGNTQTVTFKSASGYGSMTLRKR